MRSGALLLLTAAVCFADSQIKLNEKEYFEAPGFSFLVFHNNYQVGHQGGLQMLQREDRLLDSGDLFLVPKGGGREHAELRVLKREVDRASATATVYGEAPGLKLGYRIVTRTDGSRIFVTLKLDKPIDWTRVERAGFRIFLYPGAYYSKSFQGESASGVFPRQFFEPVLAGGTHTLRVAQEDPGRAITFRRENGTLELADDREGNVQGWFPLVAPLAPGSAETEVAIEIAPSIDPTWVRPPVIAVSQVGYHPNQPKRAIFELDPRDRARESAALYKLELSGERKTVRAGAPKPWGKFLRYDYAVFDFSDVREPGVYVVEYRGQTAGPFRIDAGVYEKAWRPTLEYYLPAQMCHIAVREGTRTWHGACHLDDAAQAPANQVYIDGYRQGARETRFADNQHIPGLDWGGWHDAGDHDVPGGSIAMTVLPLALAQEEFQPHVDVTTVRRATREVLIHAPDGRPDMIEQIEYGVEGLLAGYKAIGHILPGIIERTLLQYGHLGDPVNITNNRVDGDDRWAFTNRNTGLQYESVQALAAASRAMKEHSPALAKEALATAAKIWEYEQAHAPVYPINAYVPRDSGFRSEEIAATAEMLITTGEARYREHLAALVPVIQGITGEQFQSIRGAALVRALPFMPEGEYRAAVMALAKKWKAAAAERAASNPWGVEFPREISSPEYKLESRSGIHSGFVWGHGWNLQEDALRAYYFHKHLPEMFGKDGVFNVVNYVLGAHPANNVSFVSGVGARSATVAYGYNRADWSHIPGGVISGNSLIKPDLMELKEFPFLWYQTEYVMSGAGTYVFDVLAAQKLASAR
ncbi:MAG: glycoside hydrolase family 9 protein [Acidobacteriota bacterium]